MAAPRALSVPVPPRPEEARFSIGTRVTRSHRIPGLEIAPTLAIEVCPVLIRPALRIVGAEENPRHRVAQCGRAIGDHSLDNHGIATLSDAFPVLICFGHRALAIPTAPHALWFAAVD